MLSVANPAHPHFGLGRAAGRPLDEAATPAPLPQSPVAYLVALWRGEVPLSQVVWRDMALVGTVINIVAMGLAFLAVAFGASTMSGIAIHMSPAPYNIFLVAAVWRSAERAPADQAWAARIGSLLWLLGAFVI